MEQYYNFVPYILRPRFTDSGRVTLRQVDGIGDEERANPNTVRTVSFTVRTKDLPRILGEENSMLIHISEESGASISIEADMRNLMNHNALVNVWGLIEHVRSAEQMILNLIREVYDEPPSFLPLSYHYVRHEVMVLPLDKAVHLLEKNLVKKEGDTCTWIEVDASKAWKTGSPREVHVHFYGAKKDIDVAVAMINAMQIEPTATVKTNGALKKAGRLLLKGNRWMCIFLRWGGKRLWQETKVSGKFVWNRMESGCKKNGALKAGSRFASTSNFSHGKQVYRDYSVIGIRGDGRCLFRAVAHGARIRSGKPAPSESLQRELADELRARVADEFVKRREETEWFVEGDFDSYVSQMRKTHVWGGEPELLMASRVLQVPISVYINDKDSGGLISIVEYGQEYSKEDPIRVLYDGFGHYDAIHIP